MREDNRDQLDNKFAEELLDASLDNYRSAEPMAGLEERVLANLRRQSRTTRLVSWNWLSAMIATVAVVLLFTVDHLIYHQVASDPAVVDVAVSNKLSGGLDLKPTALQARAGERVAGSARTAKASARRKDLALNLNSRRIDERASSSLQVEDVRITEIRLDDIVISSNDR